jgi:hypothetical protein
MDKLTEYPTIIECILAGYIKRCDSDTAQLRYNQKSEGYV